MKGNSPSRLLVASRNELKVAKLEIDPLYICGKIPPRNKGAVRCCLKSNLNANK